jgi:hypothetical protein
LVNTILPILRNYHIVFPCDIVTIKETAAYACVMRNRLLNRHLIDLEQYSLCDWSNSSACPLYPQKTPGIFWNVPARFLDPVL